DARRVEEALSARTKAVILNNPNNPTGVVYPARVIRELVSALQRTAKRAGHAIYLIADEVYRHILYDDVELPAIFREYANSIIVTSCSKDLGVAGERIGYIAISPSTD